MSRKVPGDVIAIPEERGRWVLMNVFAHRCLGVDSDALKLLRDAEVHSLEEMEEASSNSSYEVWEIEWFSNYDGQLADPTRYLRNTDQWEKVEVPNLKSLIEFFEKHLMLVDDEVGYRARFAPKTSLLDQEHLGNFHQQLGQELLLKRRENPSDWWMNQKFTPDRLGIRNNLYKAVQEHCLKRYFENTLRPGDRVLDLGCGTGLYTNMMASRCGNAQGIDPNTDYVNIARSHAVEGARFEVVNVSQVGGLDEIPTSSVDYVFMIDALLFYFEKFEPNQVADLDVLFQDVHRILKPGGTFVSVEPHYIFWLLPWLGDADRPFTILSEYKTKNYGVTPNLGTFIQTVTIGGFAVTGMLEFYPDAIFEKSDPRAYHFAQQFPLWHLLELKSNVT